VAYADSFALKMDAKKVLVKSALDAVGVNHLK